MIQVSDFSLWLDPAKVDAVKSDTTGRVTFYLSSGATVETGQVSRKEAARMIDDFLAAKERSQET